MLYLTSLERKRSPRSGDYPHNTPVLQALDSLSFTSPVTILCGDNGCGKTTLIELLAAKLRAERISLGKGLNDAQRRIAKAADDYKLVLRQKPRHCFLFTAEGFVKYIDYVVEEKRAMQAELDALPNLYGSDYARELAAQPYAGTLSALGSLYARPLETQSHGQGFLEFFRSRLKPGGLYLMDEPEAALSYTNQLALIYLIRDAVADGCQFILATHSPILAACPEATLLEIQDDGALCPTVYPDLRSVQFLKRFLGDPARFVTQD